LQRSIRAATPASSTMRPRSRSAVNRKQTRLMVFNACSLIASMDAAGLHRSDEFDPRFFELVKPFDKSFQKIVTGWQGSCPFATAAMGQSRPWRLAPAPACALMAPLVDCKRRRCSYSADSHDFIAVSSVARIVAQYWFGACCGIGRQSFLAGQHWSKLRPQS
jgi:hypothetical protein